jgi:hypothetical protein
MYHEHFLKIALPAEYVFYLHLIMVAFRRDNNVIMCIFLTTEVWIKIAYVVTFNGHEITLI